MNEFDKSVAEVNEAIAVRNAKKQPLTAEQENILARESIVKKTLKSRSPVAWLDLVNTLDESVRNDAACIVWWDFFGVKKSKDRSDLFDAFINKRFIPCNSNDLIQALFLIGYTPAQATQRVKADPDESVETEEETETNNQDNDNND